MNAKYVSAPIALVALLAATVASAAEPNAPATVHQTPVVAPPAGARSTITTSIAPSFAGAWRLDRSKSTFPQRPEGGRGGGGMRGEGGRGGGGEMRGGGMRDGGGMGGGGGSGRGNWGGGGDGARRGRGGFMSSFLRISQVDGLVTLADSSGAAFEEIAYEDPAPPKTGTRRLGGEWNGKSLVALGDTPMGGTVTENYTLRDGGKTLEIRTKVIPEGDRPAMEFVRVYQLVAEPK